ncbi:helix-turn-helix domain-containing protein [Streptomyces niger]|uniref:helix-turn-helix domain-containing protein n=1 Tax=Streptomyces niger TaxID=66373 RepID=UPI0018FEC24D|nr:helix-turn-helix domain-containing protein [Streptomyces niger]
MTRTNEPGELPVALLRKPEMVEACRVRDFGAIFHLVRRGAGIYPSRIASLCGLTPSRVGEVMAGKRKIVHIGVIERIADGLHIPGAMLGLASRSWELAAPAAPAPEPRPVATIDNRHAVKAVDLDDVMVLTGDVQVSQSTVSALRSLIEDQWRHDDKHGGANLRPAVVGQLRHVQNLLRRGGPSPLVAELRDIAAELARLAGWAYFDARQYSTARGYFTEALSIAREAGDRQFVANVPSCMSLQATYEGEAGAREAAALAQAAQDAARGTETSSLIMSMLHMREAFAQAMLGDGGSCHRSVEKAHELFASARDEGPAPRWVQYFDETKLIVDAGIAFAQLGETRKQLEEARKAEPLITEGLRREHHEQRRGRAFHALWLANTQLRQGAVEAACRTASTALDMASAVDSPRINAHVQDFQARLRPYARETAVIALEAHLRQQRS